MNTTIVWRVLSLAALTLALSGQGMAQGSTQLKFGGLVNDYTAVLDAGGPGTSSANGRSHFRATAERETFPARSAWSGRTTRPVPFTRTM